MKSLSLSQPHLLVMVGIPGSGKSLFAERFSATFSTPLVDYSVVMEIAGGNHDISDAYAGYMLKELFKTRQTIIFDGQTATRDERNALKDLASSSGYTCLFIWTQTDKETAKSRYIKTYRKNGRNVTDAHYESLVRNFAPPVHKEHPTVVVSGKHTYATQLKAVLKNLTLTKQIQREGDTPKPREGVQIKVINRNNKIQ